MSKNLQEQLLIELKLLFEPIVQMAADSEVMFGILGSFGWDLESIFGADTDEFLSVFSSIAESVEDIQGLIDAPPETLADLRDALKKTQELVEAVGSVSEIPQPGENFVGIGELPGELLRGLFVLYLVRRFPSLLRLFLLLGLAQIEDGEAYVKEDSVVRLPTSLPTIEFKKLIDFVINPIGEIKALYAPNGLPTQQEANRVGASLFPRIAGFLDSFEFESLVGSADETLTSQDAQLDSMLTTTRSMSLVDGGRSEFGVTIVLVPESAGGPGVFFAPIGDMSLDVQSNEWRLLLEGEGSVAGALVGEDGVTFEDGTGSSASNLRLTLIRSSRDSGSLLVGSARDSRLEIDQLSVTGNIALGEDRQEYDIYLSATGAVLAVNLSDADSFLRRLLPSEGFAIPFDFGVGWSSLDGFYFLGSAALDVLIPIHETIGPVSIESIRIAINLHSDRDIALAIAASGGAKIGPVAVRIEHTGVESELSFPDAGGNLGVLHLKAPKFLPPNGAGLSINTGPIVGAGFLEIDFENARYAGILGLKAAEIGLTAIGLITTRMPDGSDGFSMLASIGVVFAPPIVEPNTGLTIMGVGGLIGLNRDMSTEALQAGLRAKALDSILFPDPATVVENASKIISDLRSVFPPAEGRLVIGPMIKAGWGGGMISAEVGVFVSLPIPLTSAPMTVSVALLGQVQGFFPQPGEEAVVELNMDILGILDTGQRMLSFQASLRDSNILKTFALYGDTAFLLSWGESPQFALAVGGFHPKFDPPPPPRLFSDLKRLGVSMSVSEGGGQFSIVCEGYHALTPNTLQFGALVDLYATHSGATFRGHATFDTLIYFSPFSLEAAIAARVSVQYKGVDLADVRLALMLTGPTPWHARGKAKFDVLGFEVDKSFSFSWGPEKRLELDAIDPKVKVREALQQREAWSAALPVGVEPLESLGSNIEIGTESLLAHPSGTVRVRQRVAPLKKTLAMVGSAPVKDHYWVEVEIIELGYLDDSEQFAADSEVSVSLEDTFESFARAQFEVLSDSQKLSVPSFEPMRSGVTARIGGIGTDESLEGKVLEFESILLTEDPIDLSDEVEVRPPSRRWPQRTRGTLAFEGTGEILCAGASRARQAATGAALSQQRLMKSGCVEVLDEAFHIVNSDDLIMAVGVEQPAFGCSRSEAERILASLDPATRSSVHIVSAWEAGSVQ